MITGPDLLLGCPHCEQTYSALNIVSGNTFGATVYPDGSMDAPMLPEQDLLSYCDHCEEFFWVDEASDHGTVGATEIIPSSPLPRLGLSKLKLAIKQKVFRNEEEEIYLRTHLWWKYNARERAGRPMFRSYRENKHFLENLSELKKILDEQVRQREARIKSIEKAMQVLVEE